MGAGAQDITAINQAGTNIYAGAGDFTTDSGDGANTPVILDTGGNGIIWFDADFL